MKVVVLLSGGMDSCTAMAQARADGAEELVGVSVQYGSLHQAAETSAACQIADWYKAAHRIVQLPGIFQDADSALMGNRPMPHMSYQEIDDQQGPSPTVVPFRNASLISIATTIAIVEKAKYVYVGMHSEDAHNFAYPDCTPEFLGSMAAAVYVGSYHEVMLQFPFIWMSKVDVCMRAMDLSAPLDLTWSCYNPVQSTPIQQCGRCPTCVERINAFRVNGIMDPVPYAVPVDWKDCIPWRHINVHDQP